MPVELFVTGTGAGISGANTGGAGTGIFPCQRPTPRGEVQRWTGELRRGGGGGTRPTDVPTTRSRPSDARPTRTTLLDRGSQTRNNEQS